MTASPTCAAVREQATLALLFGVGVERLAEEIRAHLRGCVSCRLRAGYVRTAVRASQGVEEVPVAVPLKRAE